MKKKKSSLNVSLAIIGSVALASCGEDGFRQVYNSRADCVAEYSERDCEPVRSGSSHYYPGRYYGPFVSSSRFRSGRFGSRSVGLSSVRRGGFGRSSSFHSSGG